MTWHAIALLAASDTAVSACEGNPCRALGGGPSRGQDDPRRMFRRSMEIESGTMLDKLIVIMNLPYDD